MNKRSIEIISKLTVLINEVETEFGIKFSLDEILEIQNVQNIENLLVKHGCENK